MTDTIESLRARVAELEEATNIAIEINNGLTSELDALKAGQGEPHDPEDWIQRALQAEAKLEVASWGQGEPLGVTYPKYVCGEGNTVAVRWLCEVSKRPGIGTKLFTQAPTIPEPAINRYNRLVGNGFPSNAIECLRFYCSLAMNGQDWLDVEPFFDDVTAPKP